MDVDARIWHTLDPQDGPRRPQAPELECGEYHTLNFLSGLVMLTSRPRLVADVVSES
jgi:hypothetical protein